MPETAKLREMRVNSVVRFGHLKNADKKRIVYVQRQLLHKARAWEMKIVTKLTPQGLLVWRYE